MEVLTVSTGSPSLSFPLYLFLPGSLSPLLLAPSPLSPTSPLNPLSPVLFMLCNSHLTHSVALDDE